MFGHAGTHLGRATGRDLHLCIPPERQTQGSERDGPSSVRFSHEPENGFAEIGLNLLARRGD